MDSLYCSKSPKNKNVKEIKKYFLYNSFISKWIVAFKKTYFFINYENYDELPFLVGIFQNILYHVLSLLPIS